MYRYGLSTVYENPTESETSTEIETGTEAPTETEEETETGGDISGNDPGGSVSGNGVDGPKTVGLLQKILDKITEFFTYVKTEIYDMLKSIRNAIRLDTVAGVVETIADIIANRLDDLGGFVGEIASDFEAPVELMKTKFPFSIPWDVAFIVSSFAQASETPVFEIPFQLPSYGIDTVFTLDLTDFEPLSKISRAFLSALFLIYMIHLTLKIVQQGGVQD